MNYKIDIIENINFKTSNWSGGKTTELYIYPKDSVYKNLDFNWRISSATVELDHSTFTKLPGITRYICTLNGNLSIKHNNENLINLLPFHIHKFQGDSDTESFGQVTDFNLMIGSGCDGYLTHINLTNSINFSSFSCDKIYAQLNEAFFSPDDPFYISIDNNNKYTINKNTLVLLTIPYGHSLNITLNSDKKINILRSTIVIF